MIRNLYAFSQKACYRGDEGGGSKGPGEGEGASNVLLIAALIGASFHTHTFVCGQRIPGNV